MTSRLAKHFAQHLIKLGMLDEASAESLHHGIDSKNTFLQQLLRHFDSQLIAQTLAGFLHLPFFDLTTHSTHFNFSLVPEKYIQHHQLLPFEYEQQLFLLSALWIEEEVLAEIKFHTGLMFQPAIVEHKQLTLALENHLTKKHYAAIHQLPHLNKDQKDDAPIVEWVQQILSDAVQQHASDVHFESYENFYRIRMRIDGVLYETLRPPLELAARIATRLKILAKLDIAERRLPQDGRFTLTTHHTSRECRLSSCPTLFGEKMVVRILDNSHLNWHIDHLGLEASQKKIILTALAQPQGLILVTGPTGSGKTMSLYTALNWLNTLDKNISTVEDPVEIQLAGINQVAVNNKIGLDFAQTLRAFLRQDPDVIMVGEIRDKETAEIALQAAQTGHLVLSTLHTNSTVETLTRLNHMGIAAFNIASSTSLIIAQRLVRKLCVHCKRPQHLPTQTLLEAGFAEEELPHLELYAPGECQHCVKGYKGRCGVFEILELTPPLIESILKGASSPTLLKLAQQHGMQTLYQSGLIKVRQGITSLLELQQSIGHTS